MKSEYMSLPVYVIEIIVHGIVCIAHMPFIK